MLSSIQHCFNEVVAAISDNIIRNESILIKSKPILLEFLSNPPNKEVDLSAETNATSFAALQQFLVDKLSINADLAHEILEYNQQRHLVSYSFNGRLLTFHPVIKRYCSTDYA